MMIPLFGAENVTLAVDGGSLLAGMATGGGSIAAGIFACVKALIAYQRSKDKQTDALVNRFLDLSGSWREEVKGVVKVLGELQQSLALVNERLGNLEDGQCPTEADRRRYREGHPHRRTE